jgi:hypothetical protein
MADGYDFGLMQLLRAPVATLQQRRAPPTQRQQAGVTLSLFTIQSRPLGPGCSTVSLDQHILMATVYVETSIISHASARPSSNLAIAALQSQARDWWQLERPKFDLVTSQLVINEASAGDPSAARDRLNLLDGIPLVPITGDVQMIANALVSASMMPPKAAADALHVAAAAFAGVEYLLTQNCRHIANARILPQVYTTLESLGFGGLLICTPAEFLGEMPDDTERNP